MNVYILRDQSSCYECGGEVEILGVYETREIAEQAHSIKEQSHHSVLSVVELPLIGSSVVSPQFPIGYSFNWQAIVDCCQGYSQEDSDLDQVFQDMEFVADDGVCPAMVEAGVYISWSKGQEVISFRSTVICHILRVAKNGALIQACVLKTQVLKKEE